MANIGYGSAYSPNAPMQKSITPVEPSQYDPRQRYDYLYNQSLTDLAGTRPGGFKMDQAEWVKMWERGRRPEAEAEANRRMNAGFSQQAPAANTAPNQYFQGPQGLTQDTQSLQEKSYFDITGQYKAAYDSLNKKGYNPQNPSEFDVGKMSFENIQGDFSKIFSSLEELKKRGQGLNLIQKHSIFSPNMGFGGAPGGWLEPDRFTTRTIAPDSPEVYRAGVVSTRPETYSEQAYSGAQAAYEQLLNKYRPAFGTQDRQTFGG